MKQKIIFKSLIFIITAFFINSVFLSLAFAASNTTGYAWSESSGWINFNPSGQNTQVASTELTGYAYGENTGWISLNCLNDTSCATVNYGVVNDGQGNLSGYAWSQSAGWINFNPTNGGVKISSQGVFSGYAYGENTGWISFNCTNDNSCATVSYGITTTWSPSSSAPAPTPAPVTSGSGGVSLLIGIQSHPSTPPTPSVPPNPPYVAPPVIAALPPFAQDVAFFAQRIPQFNQALKNVGINVTKLTDIKRVASVHWFLPGLTQLAVSSKATSKTPAPPVTKGVPVAQLTSSQKKSIPDDIVFVKTSAGTVDYATNLSFDQQGKGIQQVSTIANKPLELVIKPDHPVTSIQGFLTLTKLDVSQAPSTNSVASAPSSSQSIAELITHYLTASISDYRNTQINQPLSQADPSLLVQKFTYQNMGNGIYQASITAPSAEGQYEVVTSIYYQGKTLPQQETRLTIVVDPEGYVYTNVPEGQVRIKSAAVSLYWLNPASGKQQIWPASQFLQQNPQTTDVTGRYAFLVPPGTYQLRVLANNYQNYTSAPLVIQEDNNVVMDVQLIAKKKNLLQQLLGK